MENLVTILTCILGVIIIGLAVAMGIMCFKIVKLHKTISKKQKAVGFPVALAAVSMLDFSLLLILVIECVAMFALIVYLFTHMEKAKAHIAYLDEQAAKKKKKAAPVVLNPKVEKKVEKEAIQTVDDITVEQAHNAVSDEVASHYVEKKESDVKRYQKKSIVNIDTLCANFESGDSVNLASLIAKGLIPKNSDYVKVLARGHLNKKLLVEANDYSSDAVKMIILTGGTVTEII